MYPHTSEGNQSLSRNSEVARFWDPPPHHFPLLSALESSHLLMAFTAPEHFQVRREETAPNQQSPSDQTNERKLSKAESVDRFPFWHKSKVIKLKCSIYIYRRLWNRLLCRKYRVRAPATYKYPSNKCTDHLGKRRNHVSKTCWPFKQKHRRNHTVVLARQSIGDRFYLALITLETVDLGKSHYLGPPG